MVRPLGSATPGIDQGAVAMTPAQSLNVVRGALRASALVRKPSPPVGEGMTCNVITISRQAGIDAGAVANRVAALLNEQAPKDPNPWQSYDRRLIEQVAKEHDLPEDLQFRVPLRQFGVILIIRCRHKSY